MIDTSHGAALIALREVRAQPQEPAMRIIVTRDTKVDGKYVPASKKPIDFPEDVAKALIRHNKAVAAPAAPAKAVAPEGAAT